MTAGRRRTQPLPRARRPPLSPAACAPGPPQIPLPPHADRLSTRLSCAPQPPSASL